ncbi:MAG: LacI family DNA-binding transcriptional regulator [Propionibacteriaceae bacterium]|nr:LacI family DNA-binding transcriptional regulator [Propionibacteriaceae bacterium]
MAKRATLADVARLAGLSTTTVSMVLNDRPNTRLSAEAAERVRAAAAKLNYRPNPAARGLRIGKTRTVGFISDEVTITRYASAMIRGLLEVAEERDHTVLITESGRRADRIANALELMLDRQADGIVFGLMGAKQIELPPLSIDVPVVISNATSTGGHPCVLPDEFRAGHDAASHLLERGHRRIGFIGRSEALLDPALSVTIGVRYAGLDAALAEHGLTFAHQVDGRYWEPDFGYRGAHEIFDAAPVTAIVAANDRVAFGVYQAAQERGLRIPEDLSVVSFDDEYLASYLRPQLTTMQIPYLEMGRTAMELVLDGDPPAQTLVHMPIQERGSVRDLT